MPRTAGEELWATLRALGAECVFGLPGSQTVDAFHALKRSGLRTVVPTHEMAAAFMANGYARASGRPGILTTIPGPGFTFSLTGLAEAWLDSAPVLHVVPSAREIPEREYALQAIDQRAMAAPIVKRIFQARDANAVGATAVEAWRLATAGEPGPVMLELPEELFAIETSRGTAIPPPSPPAELPASLIDEIATLIAAAPRVLLFVGAGALDCADSVRALADATGAAVITTTSARGVLPEDDARVVIRDPGMQDAAVTNLLVERAHLVLAIGCKFSHNGAAGFNLQLPRAKLITINAAGPSNNYPARVHATADAGRLLAMLLARIEPRPGWAAGWEPAELAGWRKQAMQFEKACRMEPQLEGSGRPVGEIVRGLRAALPDDAIVVTDSGLHQMSVRRHFVVKSPRGLITPTNFQSMSFALPAAMGAALAAPDRPVVAVVGDGGMLMSGLELITAVREDIPITVVVFNDGAYGLIRNSQLTGHGETFCTDIAGPDFEVLAAVTGADYRRIGKEGVVAALEERRRGDSPVRLVEVPLVDSPGLKRVRARGRLRAVARRFISPKRRALFSRWLRR